MQKSKRRTQHVRRPAVRPAWQRVLLHPCLLFLLAALLVWLPDGFDIGPVNDGWFQLGAPLFASEPTRPFRTVPMFLGQLLSPGDFSGVQAVLLGMLTLHAVFFYAIVRRILPGQRLAALACGFLALFHCADHSYFWLGALGLQFGFVTALASCVTAIDYLDQGKRRQLAATWILQLISVFTYPGFVLVMLGIPMGAWLLRRVTGQRTVAGFLPRITIVLAAGIVFYLCMLHLGVGRNAQAADVQLVRAVQGFAWAGAQLVRSIPSMVIGLQPIQLILAAVLALLTYPMALHLGKDDAGEPLAEPITWRYLSVLLAGLLALALVSYLPYAISKVRFTADRSLLAAGMFAYSALVILLLHLARRYLRRELLALIPALLAGYTVLVGFQQRAVWLVPYRAEERFLAKIAEVVPRPYSGTTIIMRVTDPAQMHELTGFSNREGAMSRALRFMYADDTLDGAFYGIGPNELTYGPQGVVLQNSRFSRGQVVPYDTMLVLDYPLDSDSYPYPAYIRNDWLIHHAGAPPAALAYMPIFSDTQASDARICSMLEQPYWPTYCFK